MSKKKTPDALQKPVHVAILRPTHIQKLAEEGKLPKYLLSKETPEHATPKRAAKPQQAYQKVAERASKARKQTILRTKLRVIHDRVPKLPKELEPPCGECVTAPCCYAFSVHLTQEEYDSGLYGEYAVKLTDEDAKNLGTGNMARLASLHMPTIYKEGTKYYLDAAIGQACPFLEDGKCSIYETRPVTCRTYTCVGDDRITQDMRDGKVEDLGAEILKKVYNIADDKE